MGVMIRNYFFILLVFVLGIGTLTELSAQVRLPRLVRDSMVVQRDTRLKVWGWATPAEKVSIRFNGEKYSTVTPPDGKWQVIIQPVKAGGPYTMEVSASNKITLNHILAGDVWLCAGQSNMVHTLQVHQERYATEILQANTPWIRNYTLPTATNLNGPADDGTGGKWIAATAADIKKFSVVAYFFALKLYNQYHVPIGIINASVGGTPIEAWTSEAGLQAFPGLIATLQKNKDTALVNGINRAAFVANQLWSNRKTEDKGLTEAKTWFDPSYLPTHWHTINLPGYWEDQGIRNLDGVVWYRREIDVPSSMAGAPAKLALGRIVDADEVYINGVKVGNTTYQYPQRRYAVPGGLIKAGKNTIVVRVINTAGKGGFVPDKPYYLSAGEHIIDLKGEWQYKVGEVYPQRAPVVSINAQNQPSALFNAMIAPLTNYPIKGIVWYQGESNAGRAIEYNRLLPALIVDWRTQWKQNELPFVYAQLPNFMEVSYSPEESSWALLREAQLKTLSVPHTAMAVTIDLGEWNDIHPDSKQPVGERLALAAQQVAYKEHSIVYSGPVYQSYQVEGDKIRIQFSNVGGGIISSDGEPLRYFAIAGADKKFVWAKATIENEAIIVQSDEVTSPQYVRYAWADNPQDVNFYNQEGLPASPFRTDH